MFDTFRIEKGWLALVPDGSDGDGSEDGAKCWFLLCRFPFGF